MRPPQPTTRETSERGAARRREQAGLLAMVASGLVMSWGYWWYHGGDRGQLINIDRADPLEASYLVDINRADWPELIQLPGLGETLARRVLWERQTNGPFRDVDDLTRVYGIGPRTLEKVRPYLIPIPKASDWAAAEESDAGVVQ